MQESLGDAQHRVGVLPAAKTAYRAARRQVADDPRRVSELMRKEALVDHDLDQVPTALRALTRAMRLLDGVDEPWAVAQRGHLEASYAGCRHEQGRYRDAIRWALRAQAHAEATSDPRALAEAYEVLQMSHTLAGLPQPQPYGPMALAIFEELGDRSAQARALNNLAVLAWMEGHGRQALDMLGRARRRSPPRATPCTQRWPTTTGATSCCGSTTSPRRPCSCGRCCRSSGPWRATTTGHRPCAG